MKPEAPVNKQESAKKSASAKAKLKRSGAAYWSKRHIKSGRPEHIPTAKFRRKVWMAAAAGFNQTIISGMLRISIQTLSKHYAFELENAGHELVTLAATGVAEALKKKEAWALKFTLATKGKNLGWVERSEHTGKDGQALLPPINLDGMTREQLEAVLAARRAISGEVAGNLDRLDPGSDSEAGSGGGLAEGASEQGRDPSEV